VAAPDHLDRPNYLEECWTILQPIFIIFCLFVDQNVSPRTIP